MRSLFDFTVGAARVAFLSCLALLSMESCPAHSQTVSVKTDRGVAQAKAGELLVKFGSPAPASLDSIRAGIRELRSASAVVNRKIGATELKNFGSIGWQLVKLPTGMTLEEGIRFYKSQEGVADVEPNSMRYLKAVPNDPSYSRQYGLEKIGAPMAWNKTKGSNSVIVAVIDSGVNYTHEDLLPNMWKNPKEIVNGKDDDGNGVVDDIYGVDTGDDDGDPMDANHHGSHCAGIIGAAGNNGIGVSGVNWNVKIMACKVLRSDGGIPTSDIMESMQYVVTMKARGNNIRVVNESLGGPSYNQAEKELVDALGNAGILVVAAAGNETTNNDAKPSYPANYDCPNLISVAASDSNDQVADFSNYGATTVDLAAPGVDIYSTFWPGDTAYSNLSGTSMATPMVTGAAALLASFSSSQTPISLKKVLMDTVDTLPQWEGKVVTGGRMNLARALQSIDPNGLPTVNSVSPRAVVNALKPPIVVNFSKPMNPASVQSNWSLKPSVSGTFAWSNNNQTMTFTPSSNLLGGSAYQGRIKGDALSAANIKLDGDLSQTSSGSPSDDYTWTFRIDGRPSNDNFASAMPLSGDSGFVPAHNFGATRETGEPRHGNYYGPGDKSVWFKWTAPVTGNVIFNTNGSTLSHVLAAYSGSSLTSLVEQEQNDTFHGGTTIEFRALAGVTYSVVVDGMYFPPTETTPAFTDTGNIGLNWTFYRSPANDNYSGAQQITGTTGSATGNTLGAYYEAGESSHIGADSSVWFKWTAPANGAVTFDTEGSAFDTTLCAFTGSPIASAKEVAHDADGGTDSLSQLPFTVSAGTTYYITVGGAGYAFYDARGDFKLNWKFVNAPVNDHFSGASVLSLPTGGSLSTSTYGATLEQGEPAVEYDDGIASIWYGWTAPSSGLLTLDTLGSGFDTNLGVFTGASLTNLTAVDENDDDESVEERKTSKIKFTAVGGTKYWIRIDSPAYASSEASIGYNATHGSVKLTWAFTSAPSNDLFANAQLLTTSNGRVIGTNVGANIETAEPQPTYRDEGASIWYKWKAPADGAATFGTGGSTRTNGLPMNTHIAIYTGTKIDALEEVDANDDDELNAPTETSRVRFTVVNGTTYYIRIDYNGYDFGDSAAEYDAKHGTINLQWDFVGAPSNDRFANAINLTPATSGRVSGTTVGANIEPNEDVPTYRDEGSSIWYKWTAPGTGPVTFSLADSKNLSDLPYDTHLAVYTGSVINGLDWVDSNGDNGSQVTSRLTIDAESGVTYIIRVDNEAWDTSGSVTNFNRTHGQIYLSWSYNNAPINAPAISGFTPASGQPGTSVTITGTNLDGATAVYFDGVTAAISSASVTSVTVTAPTGVRTGKISITTPRGNAASATDFKVPPVISSFTPGSGNVGNQVTITGQSFYGVTSVTFGGVEAGFTVNSPTQIVATVPTGALTGKIGVTTAGGTGLSSTIFILPARIDSFSPQKGVIKTVVTIKGANFTGTTEVQFNGVKAIPTTVSDSTIVVAVPTGATTGLISIVTPGGIVKTATNFVVLRPPTIASFTPASGKAGTAVTITGTNFTGATAVRFNGTAAVNPNIAANSITALVPAGATTGYISVVAPDGTAQSVKKFVIDNAVPVVTITSPTQNQSLPSSAFTSIVGMATDNLSVSQVQIKLSRTRNNVKQFWNGTSFGTAEALLPTTLAAPNTVKSKWTYTVTPALLAALDSGAYLVEAVAKDGVGNQGLVLSRNFNLDTQKPQVDVTSPTQNQTLPSYLLTALNGTASDNIGVAQVQIQLTRTRDGVKKYWNGSIFGSPVVNLNVNLLSAGATTATWNYPVSNSLKKAFDTGQYQLNATAKDAAGNVAATVERLFNVTADKVKPTTITNTPTKSQVVAGASFVAIAGTANDNTGVTQVQIGLTRTRGGVRYFWNGTTFATPEVRLDATLSAPNATNTNWSCAISPALKAALDSGSYVLYVSARDAWGNQFEASARNFNVDFVKPVAKITTPAQSQNLTISSFTSITGVATDNISIAQAQIKLSRVRNGVKLYWNGSSFTNTETLLPTVLATPNTNKSTWTYTVSPALRAVLDAGEYVVEAVTKDSAGMASDSVTCNFVLTNSLAGVSSDSAMSTPSSVNSS